MKATKNPQGTHERRAQEMRFPNLMYGSQKFNGNSEQLGIHQRE